MLAALAGAMLAGCVPGPRDAGTVMPAEWNQQRFEWTGPVSANERFDIVNFHGDVRVRTTDRGEARITAQLQTAGHEQFDIRLIEAGGAAAGVEVLASHQAPRGRADVTVFVPPGKVLSVTTTDDLAEITYRGDVGATTTSGRIFIKTAGHVVVETATGDVDLALSALRPRRPIEIDTRGNINAWFPRGASLELSARGRGVDIQLPGLSSRYQGEGAIMLGDGGARINLNSRGGRTHVRSLPPG